MDCERIAKEMPQDKVDMIQRFANGEEKILLEYIDPSIGKAVDIINELVRQGRIKVSKEKDAGHFNVLTVL